MTTALKWKAFAVWKRAWGIDRQPRLNEDTRNITFRDGDDDEVESQYDADREEVGVDGSRGKQCT